MLHQILNETPMPVNPRPYLPETEDSIARAKAACELERQRLREATGVLIADDGTISLPVTDDGIPLQDRLDCAAVIAGAVRKFGLATVQRAVLLEVEAGR